MRNYLLVILLSIPVSAYSAYIVDTGQGNNNSSGSYLGLNQALAGQFTLDESFVITSVEGWIGKYSHGVEGTITAAIYTNSSASLPGNQLFSQKFVLDSPIVGANAWDGAYNLNWSLSPGQYWLVFKPGFEDTADNYFMPWGVPSPLDNYAYSNAGSGGWSPESSGYGMRIGAIPIPAAVWLFGSGLIGLIGVARRKKA